MKSLYVEKEANNWMIVAISGAFVLDNKLTILVWLRLPVLYTDLAHEPGLAIRPP